MSTTAIVEADKLQSKVAPIVEWANCLSVTNADEFQDAADRLKGIKGLMKEVADTFGPIKRAQDAAKKATLEQERKYTGPLEQAESMAKRKMLDWQREENRKAEEQRRKLQAEADERARREREEAMKKAAAAKKPETKAKYEEQAAAVVAPLVHVEPEATKVAGISTRKVWKSKVVDVFAFYRWAVDHERWELLAVNDKAIDSYAKAAKESAMIPGVVFFSEEVMAAGSR